ncbi:Methylated-DNA--protein-cysteine methyltransferase, constitutive [Slackia heliotrinireducens]|uniref:O-6-methylguanine DNA methyltransferase n=1 Tax=Slackia heliotrinireducens (strain ATCC 29202 / DSM 20476 / NCTC 11029 / RHS 1) TaxID=471855 RepID=C7N7B7_SLAHD|nr:MGMT family protein [Slackia heliotrinireducens]ACV22802.1 O-6-methylguanine DNA methyltransferase [Slackia heliotrinireducens DSM 20476]VEH01506.1 Methylated-DNA--protein-cysteine methyltransferase, constitutive [Slackia heliotrinireducens]
MGSFNDKVYEVVREIPYGRVTTYGAVARAIGQPRKALFVGFAMHSSADPDDPPCHRVVYKDGRVFENEDGSPSLQKLLLEAEGVPFLDDTHVDLDACLWHRVPTDEIGRPTDIDWEREMAEDQ